MKAAALAAKVLASAGSIVLSSAAIASATLPTVGRSYQTCSLSSPSAALIPETSTALITGAVDAAEASIVCMKSS